MSIRCWLLETLARVGRIPACLLFATLIGGLSRVADSGAAQAEPVVSGPTMDPNGTLSIPSFTLPLSAYMSDQAKSRYIEESRSTLAKEDDGNLSIRRIRELVDEWYRPKVERAQAK